MSFLNRNSSHISRHTTFVLTSSGRDRLEDFRGSNKDQILVSLETKGSSTIDDIAQATGIPRGQIESILPGLMKGGFVQKAATGMMED